MVGKPILEFNFGTFKLCLVGWILGRKETKEWKIREKISGRGFGWKGEGKKKMVKLSYFLSGPPKLNFPKIGR